MSGLPYIRTQQVGCPTCRIMILTIVLALTLCGCSLDFWVGDGRGDWTKPIFNGYAISKINSKEILLIYQDNPNDSGGSIILPNFFICSYQQDAPYICLKGIQTNRMTISESELNSAVYSYFFVDTSTGEVVGAFSQYDDLEEYCTARSMELAVDWIPTNEH